MTAATIAPVDDGHSVTVAVDARACGLRGDGKVAVTSWVCSDEPAAVFVSVDTDYAEFSAEQARAFAAELVAAADRIDPPAVAP